MSLVDFSAFLVDEDSSEDVKIGTINKFFQAAQDAYNNITNEQIPDDEIELVKVEDGAVPESDITLVGAANKIPKTDASGNLIMADGGALEIYAT